MSWKAKWWSVTWVEWDHGRYWGHCDLKPSHCGRQPPILELQEKLSAWDMVLVWLHSRHNCSDLTSLLFLPPKLPEWDSVKKQMWSTWYQPAWIHILPLEMQQFQEEIQEEVGRCLITLSLEHGNDAETELHGVRYGGKRRWGAGERANGSEIWNIHEQMDGCVRTFPMVCVHSRQTAPPSSRRKE